MYETKAPANAPVLPSATSAPVTVVGAAMVLAGLVVMLQDSRVRAICLDVMRNREMGEAVREIVARMGSGIAEFCVDAAVQLTLPSQSA